MAIGEVSDITEFDKDKCDIGKKKALSSLQKKEWEQQGSTNTLTSKKFFW
nr:hypothetical protein [Clostridium sp. DJ247]